ncbi:MAG: RluA family pseudouridine synthase [Planctomycetota bacterium]
MSGSRRAYRDLSRPIREFSFAVEPAEAGLRLDALLRAHYPWKSRAHFQRMLEAGDALLNGSRSKASARVRTGDRVVVKVPVGSDVPEQESADGLVFLYEDAYVAAVDKPCGMAVHPVGRIRHGTLINKLHAHYRDADPSRDVVPRLGHRLDQDTSGVVLVVKDRRTDALVTHAFARRRVDKTYLALVEGVPRPAEGVVDVPLAQDPQGDTILHMRVDPEGQQARSRYRVVRSFARHALVELKPLTGRTHQLRVHMAHLGHPILCDHLYGDLRPVLRSNEDPSVPPCEDRVVLGRLALHAHRLELDHPVTGAPLRLESPMPADLQAAVDAFAGGAAAPTTHRMPA